MHEVTGLRKQIVDLKEAMVARRRVEEALREAESRLRSLADGAPVGLCLFQCDGAPLTANTPFARMLGYDSPAELQRVGGVLGIFASREEQARVLGGGSAQGSGAFFRQKNGASICLNVMASHCPQQNTVALAIYRPSQE